MLPPTSVLPVCVVGHNAHLMTSGCFIFSLLLQTAPRHRSCLQECAPFPSLFLLVPPALACTPAAGPVLSWSENRGLGKEELKYIIYGYKFETCISEVKSKQMFFFTDFGALLRHKFLAGLCPCYVGLHYLPKIHWWEFLHYYFLACRSELSRSFPFNWNVLNIILEKCIEVQTLVFTTVLSHALI